MFLVSIKGFYMSDIDLEIYDGQVSIVHIMCFLHKPDMLYNLSHYNVTNFHMQGSH